MWNVPSCILSWKCWSPVADPGFSVCGVLSRLGGADLWCGQFLVKTCAKTKELHPGGVGACRRRPWICQWSLLDSLLASHLRKYAVYGNRGVTWQPLSWFPFVPRPWPCSHFIFIYQLSGWRIGLWLFTGSGVVYRKCHQPIDFHCKFQTFLYIFVPLFPASCIIFLL